jgi:hypothetical protein
MFPTKYKNFTEIIYITRENQFKNRIKGIGDSKIWQNLKALRPNNIPTDRGTGF